MTLTSRTGVKAEGIEGLFEALAAALFEDDAVVGEVVAQHRPDVDGAAHPRVSAPRQLPCARQRTDIF